MVLKRQKGKRIETKTLKSLLRRDNIDLNQTMTVYRESVAFYIQVINQHPEYIDLSQAEMRQAYEQLTLGDSALYPFLYSDMPRDLRWDVISTACGHYKAWKSNYENWKKKEEKRLAQSIKKNKKHTPHKPPVLPTEVYDNPTYYKTSMFKEDTGNSVILKIRKDNAWAWVKFHYSSYFYDSAWTKGCPTLVFKKDGTCWINWTLERYHDATGGLKALQDERVCSVDIDLDGDVISTLSILEPDVNGEVKEVSRTFIKGHASHVRRRKRELGKIAKKMTATATVAKGFASKYWEKISNREKSEGYRIASEIVNFAKKHHSKVIVFEYLNNLRPQKGKYSARSNQKRAYWLKSKIFEFVKYIARTKFNILTSRVSPKDTSKFSAIDGSLMMRTSDNQVAELIAAVPRVWENFLNTEGYHPGTIAVAFSGYMIHSGLNAARNIGMKFYQRYKTEKLKFVSLQLAH
ncbi:MAG: hypothetical protein DSM106950_45495 [Stigonema ocellatum SAG 48.90 = DSM 106950]|nr:hypothetical protein [Stigonema ocellatum SAG 48.90 = DSM 106950]